MAVVTLASLRSQVRQRADMVNSLFVSDAEANGYISSSAAELYDILVTHYGEEYYLAGPIAFNTTANQSTYALSTILSGQPALYKLVGLDIQSGSDWIAAKPFMFADRNSFQSSTTFALAAGEFYRYRLQGGNIVFAPTPAAATSCRLWYVPQMTALTVDGDTFDGINGWEEYIVVDAAIKCLNKEESDVSVLMAQKEALRQRIITSAPNRDAGEPQRVVDVSGRDYDVWGY